MTHRHDHDAPEEHDLGLGHDLPTLLTRRRALGLMSAACLSAALAACGASTEIATTSQPTGGPSSPPGGGGGGEPSVDVGDGEIPEETAGPYPGDGSNGANVLTESGVVRSDIRSSFGSASGLAEGVPLTIRFTLVDVSSASDAGTPVSGAAIYAWHCDREGRYSMYDSAIVDENYLRGVQETGSDGSVEFTSIFPAAYSGRWPHVHVEVYPSLIDAQSATSKQRTTQLAFPADVCDEVYATAGYEASVQNMQQTSLSSDMVFGDGHALQMATMTGSASSGLTATLRVPI